MIQYSETDILIVISKVLSKVEEPSNEQRLLVTGDGEHKHNTKQFFDFFCSEKTFSYVIFAYLTCCKLNYEITHSLDATR